MFYRQMLTPLRSFDWKASSSPLSALGGMKGVSKAYELLSQQLQLKDAEPLKVSPEFK
jgi:hypothetical protein